MDSRLIHFQIPADDVDKLADFYRKLFEWKIEPMGPPEMQYWAIETVPGDKNAVSGGMMKRQNPGQSITDYILVADVAASLAKAQELGAQVLVGKTEIPDMGWFGVIMDPQHNVIGVFEGRSDMCPDR